jgi:hypothetical protein
MCSIPLVVSCPVFASLPLDNFLPITTEVRVEDYKAEDCILLPVRSEVE